MILSDPAPTGAPVLEDRYLSLMWERWLVRFIAIVNNQQATGTTAQRPVLAPYVGFQYFDTTVNKPIWAKTITTSATTWVYADGTAA